MKICASMSKNVNDYYTRHCKSQREWDLVINKLLEHYDVSSMPPVREDKYTQRMFNITNEDYLSLYYLFGARSKKVSLSRILQFGMDVDIFSFDEFANIKADDIPVNIQNLSKKKSLLKKALNLLKDCDKIKLSAFEAADDEIVRIETYIETYIRSIELEILEESKYAAGNN